MRRAVIIVMLVAAALGACGSDAGAVAALAQDDEPGPVRLAPPESSVGADAELTVQVEVGDFAGAWSEARAIAVGAGGVVTSATTGVVQEDGRRYSHGTVSAQVDTARLDDVLGSLGSLGTVVRSDVRLVTAARSTSTIVVTLTESPSVVPSVDGEPGRVQRALDTAGDILLAMLSVAIVAGAVIIPLGLVAVVGLAVWRRFAAERVVVVEHVPPTDDEEPADRVGVS